VALTYFGDGATSTGSCHEGINFAAVQRLPIIFICENNQIALTTPTEKQCALDQLVDRALGYGIPGVQVDGNDVLEVYRVTKEAVDSARKGGGPTFIEAITMRMHGHASFYKPPNYPGIPPEKLDGWQLKDPIRRFSAFLHEQGVLDDALEAEISARLKEEIEDAVAYAESCSFLPPEEVLTDVFAEEAL
jgi:TPP-dependent pyruvate/acetoin dehydrogenase alpha subunit